jgi:hypothetical protein
LNILLIKENKALMDEKETIDVSSEEVLDEIAE